MASRPTGIDRPECDANGDAACRCERVMRFREVALRVSTIVPNRNRPGAGTPSAAFRGEHC